MRRSSSAWTSSAPRRVRVRTSTRSDSSCSRSLGRRLSHIPISTACTASSSPSTSSTQIGQKKPPWDSSQEKIDVTPSTPETAAWTAKRRGRPGGACQAMRTKKCSASGIASPSQTQPGQK